MAPGSLISLFGLDLSEGQAIAEDLPLETTLAGTTVVIAGRRLPLLFTSDRQVNGMVPYDLNVNTQHQVLVRRSPTYATSVSVDVAASQPAVFVNPQQNAERQGHIYVADASGGQSLAGPNSPATAGDAIVFYCSGLGVVEPPLVAGTAAPFEEPLARTVNPISVTVGGVQANVFFSGLTPGFSGLYQINAFVPQDVTTGDEVPVVLGVAGQSSPRVTIAVQ